MSLEEKVHTILYQTRPGPDPLLRQVHAALLDNNEVASLFSLSKMTAKSRINIARRRGFGVRQYWNNGLKNYVLVPSDFVHIFHRALNPAHLSFGWHDIVSLDKVEAYAGQEVSEFPRVKPLMINTGAYFYKGDIDAHFMQTRGDFSFISYCSGRWIPSPATVTYPAFHKVLGVPSLWHMPNSATISMDTFVSLTEVVPMYAKTLLYRYVQAGGIRYQLGPQRKEGSLWLIHRDLNTTINRKLPEDTLLFDPGTYWISVDESDGKGNGLEAYLSHIAAELSRDIAFAYLTFPDGERYVAQEVVNNYIVHNSQPKESLPLRYSFESISLRFYTQDGKIGKIEARAPIMEGGADSDFYVGHSAICHALDVSIFCLSSNISALIEAGMLGFRRNHVGTYIPAECMLPTSELDAAKALVLGTKLPQGSTPYFLDDTPLPF
jgi:hypothetical protein